MRSPCNDIFCVYSYKLELCVYYGWKKTSKILKSIYVYILNILRLHRIKISNLVHFFLTKTFMSTMRMLTYCKSLYILFRWACCSPLISSFITQHQIDKLNRTKLPIRERIGNVPQFPIGVDVAVAEVGTTNRLGFQLLMYQTYIYS